jgi:hypothetical protein
MRIDRFATRAVHRCPSFRPTAPSAEGTVLTGVSRHFDLRALRRDPCVAFYFRCPLHHSDFHELRQHGRLLGRFAARPLYGRLKGGRQNRPFRGLQWSHRDHLSPDAGAHGSRGHVAVHAAATGASRISQWTAQLARNSRCRRISGEVQARAVEMRAQSPLNTVEREDESRIDGGIRYRTICDGRVAAQHCLTPHAVHPVRLPTCGGSSPAPRRRDRHYDPSSTR